MKDYTDNGELVAPGRDAFSEKLVQLETSEQRYRSILHSIGDGVIVTDVNGLVVELNHVAEQLTGWTQEQAMGRLAEEIFRIVNEETGETVESPVSRVLREGKVVGLANHTMLINRHGTQRPIADSGAPVFDTSGDLTGVVLVFRDQTEERLRQRMTAARLELLEYAATHSLERVLTRAIDQITDLVESPIGFFHFVEADQQTISHQTWSTRTVQEFCRVKPESRLYGIADAGIWVDCVHTRAPVVHNDYASLPHRKGLPEGHAPVVRELVVPVMRTDSIVAILGVGNKGTDYTKHDVEIVNYLADVTWQIVEQKTAEQALRQREEKLSLLFETMPAGWAEHRMVFDDDGHPCDYIFLEVNSAFERFTGLTREMIVGKKVTEVIPGIRDARPDLIALYGKVVTTGEELRLDLYFEPFDRWYNVTAFTRRAGHFVAMFEDVTAAKKARERIAQEEMKVSTFLDNTSDLVTVVDACVIG